MLKTTDTNTNKETFIHSNLDNLVQKFSLELWSVIEGHVGLALMQQFLIFILTLCNLTSTCPARISKEKCISKQGQPSLAFKRKTVSQSIVAFTYTG